MPGCAKNAVPAAANIGARSKSPSDPSCANCENNAPPPYKPAACALVNLERIPNFGPNTGATAAT